MHSRVPRFCLQAQLERMSSPGAHKASFRDVYVPLSVLDIVGPKDNDAISLIGSIISVLNHALFDIPVAPPTSTC